MQLAEDQLLFHCLVQGCVEGGVDASDSLIGETCTIELLAQQSAVLLEMGIELLDVPGGQLVQLDIAQGRNDVLIDPPLVGHLGVGPEGCLLIVLVPVIQPVSQGEVGLRNFRGGRCQSLPQGPQLCRTLRFRLSKDILRLWQPLLVIVDDYPALPTAVLSQTDAAVAVFSAFCHGAISSPK